MNIGLGIGIPFTRSNLWTSIFTPTALFMDGSTEGVWYDPSDIKLNWRRNLLTYSEQFDNAVWVKSNATVTPNAVVAPDGTLTADKFVPAAAGGVHFIDSMSAQVIAGNYYTATVYFKYDAVRFVLLAFNYGSFVAGNCVCFDLVSGQVSNYGVGSSSAGAITPVSDGWFRCSITMQATATGTVGAVPAIYASGASTNTLGSTAYTGDGTSGIYIWGAQLELGSTSTEYQKITDGVSDYLTYQPLPVLYQDAAGTTPVTAVEQPVGLMLDKSKGLVLGPELVTNGGFDSTAGWTTDPGWVISGGKAVATNASGGYSVYQAASVSPEKLYRVTFTISNYVSGGVFASLFDGDNGLIYSANGTYTEFILAKNTRGYLGLAAATGGFTGSIDNISVRELPGNHAYQTVSTKRGTLSARRNKLVGTETLATQTVTTRATPYILSFYGTGTVTLSGTSTAGPLVGTGANNRVYLEFTPTAGTLTLTVSGMVSKAQLEVANEGL